MAIAILFTVFAVLLVLGVPVGFSLIAASLATVLYLDIPAIVVVQQTAAGAGTVSLIAIPLFIFAGELMMRGGISERLISFASSLVGHQRGGLGQVNVLASLFFGGVSGSAIADVSAIGGSLIPHAKAGGQYLNSVLAKIESVKAGYQEAILLDTRGFVCEGTGENIYIVRDGEIITPPQTASILDGISRKSIVQIMRDMGIEVVERDIARSELYLADEVFVCGTAAELTPLREIDDHAIGAGKPGELTVAVQKAFEDALHGRTERYREWLDPVPAELYEAAAASDLVA